MLPVFATTNNFEVIWSLPKSKAFKTYESVGFVCEDGELIDSYKVNGVMQKEHNCYAEKKLK